MFRIEDTARAISDYASPKSPCLTVKTLISTTFPRSVEASALVYLGATY